MRLISKLMFAAASLAALAGPVVAAPAAPLSAAEAKAKALSAQLQLMEDRREVERLHMVFGFYFDKMEWDEAAALFAPNGSMELNNRGVFIGPAHIRKALTVFGEGPIQRGQLFNHIQMQPVVTVASNGRTAKARWKAFIQTGFPGQPGEWADGVYENEYVKDGGIWKIGRLRYCQTMRTDYAKGWAKDAKPAPGIDPRFKPDRPPTGGCKAYPEIEGPAFHFSGPAG